MNQAEFISSLEQNVAWFDLGGYSERAWQVGQVVEALYRGESVWAVLLADAYGLTGYVEPLRTLFSVGRIA